jgi:hypothetical protein
MLGAQMGVPEDWDFNTQIMAFVPRRTPAAAPEQEAVVEAIEAIGEGPA